MKISAYLGITGSLVSVRVVVTGLEDQLAWGTE
jgi:hypothetical protein